MLFLLASSLTAPSLSLNHILDSHADGKESAIPVHWSASLASNMNHLNLNIYWWRWVDLNHWPMPYEDTALTTMLHRHYLEPKVGDDPTTYCLLSNCSANVSYSGITEMKRHFLIWIFRQSCADFIKPAFRMVLVVGFEPTLNTPWTCRLLPFGLHKLAGDPGVAPGSRVSETRVQRLYQSPIMNGINGWIWTIDLFHVKEALLPTELHWLVGSMGFEPIPIKDSPSNCCVNHFRHDPWCTWEDSNLHAEALPPQGSVYCQNFTTGACLLYDGAPTVIPTQKTEFVVL